MKLFMQKACLIIFGLFLCVLFLELGLRVGRFFFLSVQEHRNAISARQKGTYRILCLGESTTANTWPGILERILNGKNIGIKFSVIDKGKPGTNSQTILDHVESYLDEYHPDAVVAMMGVNDERVSYYKSIPEANTWIFQHCQAYKFVRTFCAYILKRIKQEYMRGLKGSDADKDAAPENAGVFDGRRDLPSKGSNGYAPAGAPTRLPHSQDITRETIAVDPTLGWEVHDKGLDKKIEKSYLEAIKQHPKDQKLYLSLAVYYDSRRKYAEAEKVYLDAMSLDPKVDSGYYGLALMYEHHGENNKAGEIYRKMIKANIKEMLGYYGLSSLYCRQGQYDKAEEVLKKGIAMDPGNSASYGSLALIYEKQNKHSLAKECSEKAESLRSRNVNSQTQHSFRELQGILRRRNIKLVLVQYPLRNIKPLKKRVDDRADVVFVDNELIFKKALETSKYEDYFIDRFAGDFGHCTPRGYELLAGNIARVILKDVLQEPS